MRFLFFGTPGFARVVLERLLASRHQAAAVVTAPDKPSGRGRRLKMSEVKEYALANGLEVLQPKKLKDAEFLERVKEIDADLFAVVAFRILPEKLYSLPRWGAINLHASLLPRFRGAAPIERALMAGATTTGVTTFQITKKVDTGDLLLAREVPIGENETYEELCPRLADIGADLLAETLDCLEAGTLVAQPQNPADASPAPKITTADSLIDWERSAETIINQVRGLAGSADAYTWLGGRRLKVYRAVRRPQDNGVGAPGEVVRAERREGLIVATGNGAVSLREVRLEGKKRMMIDAFLNGVKVTAGTKLTAS